MCVVREGDQEAVVVAAVGRTGVIHRVTAVREVGGGDEGQNALRCWKAPSEHNEVPQQPQHANVWGAY